MSTATEPKATQLIEVENDLLEKILNATRAARPQFTTAEVELMASRAAKSRLYGMDENQLFVLMQIAQAEGCHPITAAQRYHIIQGKPAKKAEAMLADFQKIGGSVEWMTESDDKVKCEAIFRHPTFCPKGKVVRFTYAQAEAAGLPKQNPNWYKYPPAQLRARVVTSAVRMIAPNVTAGLMTPDEVRELPPDPEPIDLMETAWDRLNDQDVAETMERHAASQAAPAANGQRIAAEAAVMMSEDEAMDRVPPLASAPREPGADDEPFERPRPEPPRKAKVQDGPWLARELATRDKEVGDWYVAYGQWRGFPADVQEWSPVMVRAVMDAEKEEPK